jgi:hypothetical protein
MKIGFMLVASMLAGTPAATADRQSATAESPYTLPDKAVALKDSARDVVFSAKTIAIVARDQHFIEVVSVDEKRGNVTVAMPGGIRRGIDAAKAAKDVQRMLTQWKRFTVVDDPSQADLVLFIFEDSVPPSRFAKTQGDAKHRLRDRLGLFRGGPAADRASEPLWADSHTESAFGALTGSSAAKVADKFRRAVEDAENKSRE